MKKKVLFVMESLGIGGAEKSLVTLLSMLDYDKYDVDLFLFRVRGEFLDQVPDQVSLLNEDTNARYFLENFKTAWIKYLVHGDWLRSWHSLCWLVGCCFNRFILHRPEYYGWNHAKKIYSKLPKHYDIAIGYLEKNATYFTVDCVKADKKFAFMHTDYESIPHDEKLDKAHFSCLNGLAVVSQHTGETMLKYFPFMKGKVHVIKNMVSPEVIYHMATDKVPDLKTCNPNTIKIVTVGRLTTPKNMDGAIDILYHLRKNGLNVEWFVIGDGEERSNLEKKIAQRGVTDYFHLLGAKSNPYPYMAGCDLYVQPSRWEGYGITVAEAKILKKTIITSDIPEFRELLVDGVTGKIAQSKDDFVSIIMELATHPETSEALINNLKTEEFFQSELKKFYTMIEA